LVPLPAANAQGVPLTLAQTVAIAVANNQDQYVTVNAAESFEYLIVQNKGIYDPLINAAVNLDYQLDHGAGRVDVVSPSPGS